MAVVITYADVINGFNTSVPESIVDLLIETIDEADECLDANSVSAAKQELLKITAVRHMATLMGASESGKGAVTSESAPSGASRSYKAPSGGSLESTSCGIMLKQLDAFGCVVNLLENNVKFMFKQVGRSRP
jgi:hypothetical protein